MGNNGSSASAIDASYSNTVLVTLTVPVVAIDARFCNPAPVKIQLKKMFLPSKLKFKDLDTGTVLFRTGGEADYITRLLDGDKKTPIVVLKRLIRNAQTVHAGDNNGGTGEKLFDVHFKLGESNSLWFEDTELFVDFMDPLTGERCKIVLDGDWRKHSVVFWLVRGEDAAAVTKEPVAKVTPKSTSKLNTKYVLKIAAHVDTALLVLLCVLLEDKLRIDRLEFNQRLLSPLDPTEHRHVNRKSVL